MTSSYYDHLRKSHLYPSVLLKSTWCGSAFVQLAIVIPTLLGLVFRDPPASRFQEENVIQKQLTQHLHTSWKLLSSCEKKQETCNPVHVAFRSSKLPKPFWRSEIKSLKLVNSPIGNAMYIHQVAQENSSCQFHHLFPGEFGRAGPHEKVSVTLVTTYHSLLAARSLSQTCRAAWFTGRSYFYWRISLQMFVTFPDTSQKENEKQVLHLKTRNKTSSCFRWPNSSWNWNSQHIWAL